MVEFTPELLAILAYTAFALFLSLYFVPFKVVPKAWAKAIAQVDKDGKPTHPAGIALGKVLDGAAVKIAKEVKVPTLEEIKAQMPTIPPFPEMPVIPDYGAQIKQMHGQLNARLTKEVETLKASIPVVPPYPTIPDYTVQLAELPKASAFKAMGEDFQEVKQRVDQLSDEHLLGLMKAAIKDYQLAAAAREGRQPAGAKAEQEAAIARNLINAAPEESGLYKRAMSILDTLEKNPKITGIRTETVKGWRKSVVGEFAENGTIRGALDSMGFNIDGLEGLMGGAVPGAPGVTVIPKGGRAPGVP